MDPEFKEYLDAWFARLERGLDHLLTLRAAVPSPAVSDKACYVTESAPPSSGTTELVTASAGLTAPSATVPVIGEPRTVAPAAPMDTISVVPAACSTDCVAQTIPVFTAAAASDGTFDDEAKGWFDSSKPRPMPWPSWLKTASAPATPKAIVDITKRYVFACSHEGVTLKHAWLLPQVTSVMKYLSGDLNSMRASSRYLPSVQLMKPCPFDKMVCWIPTVPRDTPVPSPVTPAFIQRVPYCSCFSIATCALSVRGQSQVTFSTSALCCSVPDLDYKWLMLWSKSENKTLVSCYHRPDYGSATLIGLHVSVTYEAHNNHSGNAKVQGTRELMDIPAHYQFVRKEEFARSEKYANDNLTIEGKRVLITWSLTSIYCGNTTDVQVQSSKETICYNLMCYYPVFKGRHVLDMQLLKWFDISVFSSYTTLLLSGAHGNVSGIHLKVNISTLNWFLSGLELDCLNFSSMMHDTSKLSLLALIHVGLACNQGLEVLSIRGEGVQSTKRLLKHEFTQLCYRAREKSVVTATGNSCVCVHELQLARSGINGVPLNSIIASRNCCQIKWPESILVYSDDMGPLCSGIFRASDGTSCESNRLEFKNKVFYMVQQYIDLSSFGIQASLYSLSKSTSRARMQRISHSNKGSYSFNTVVLNYMGFPAVYAPIHVGCTPSSICDASYSTIVELYMAAREFFLLQDGICSWADSENMTYAGQAWLSHSFVLMFLLDEQLLLTLQSPIAYCSITSSMFNDPALSILAMCEGWHALFLFQAFARQVVFQGGRCAIIPIICYITRDSCSDFPGSLDSNGLKVLQVTWDPGVCISAAISSMLCAPAFRIWLVAWTVDGLEFSMGHGQAPFQGGRNVIRAAFSDQVHISHDCYSTFINKIPVDSYYYLDQACYFDTVSTDLIYYRENNRGDSTKPKEAHMPWDPGELVLYYHPKLRLGDKPNFKEGGMLGAHLTCTHTWASLLGQLMDLAAAATNSWEKATYWSSWKGSGTAAAATLLSHLALIPFLLHACSCI